MARQCLASQPPDHTLQSTALVHEAYMRLVGRTSVHWENRVHFLAVAAFGSCVGVACVLQLSFDCGQCGLSFLLSIFSTCLLSFGCCRVTVDNFTGAIDFAKIFLRSSFLRE